jgi:membrane-bound lytic murein transglycosylase B
MTYKESNLNYRQFLGPRFIRMGKKYLKEHKTILLKAQIKYGVPPHLIVALLTVETQLGQYVGRYRVFNVLSSLALVGIKKNFFSSLNLPQTVVPRLEKKAKWAYKELKAFLHYTQQNGFDPLFIKGSLAGAFGIPQFVPILIWCMNS